jgi:hypothetical protein
LTEYRFFVLGEHDVVTAAIFALAEDDAEAAMLAGQLSDLSDRVEVWDVNRLVGVIHFGAPSLTKQAEH